MNLLTREDLAISVNAATNMRDYLSSNGALVEGALQDTVRGVPSSKLLSQTSYDATEERVSQLGDYVLIDLLHASFVTVVHQSQWESMTAIARPFDLESLAPHEIFLRIKTLDDDNFLLLPDDRLEVPSLMFQALVTAGRVGVLKLELAGDTLRWSTVNTGTCSGLTGSCEPNPPCQWRYGQDGAGVGWVCC
jgi:hypothetical protein